MNKNALLIGGGFAGLGSLTLITLIHDIYQTKKMNKVCENLNTTVDKVANGVQVDIDDVVVEQAIEKAAKAEAARKVRSLGDEAVNAVRNDLQIGRAHV